MAGVPAIAAISVDYPGSLLDVRHRVPDDLHEVERTLSLVATLGHALPAGDDGRLRVRRHPDLSAGRPARRPLRGRAPRRLGARPGLGARGQRPARRPRWPALGYQVVVTGGPSERDLCAGVAGAAPGVVDLSGATGLAGLAEVLAGADAVVVGNTGPAHLAAAVGTPVVSIFAPDGAGRRGGGRGASPTCCSASQDIACAGCRSRVCPIPGQPCIGGVEVDDVVAAVAGLTRATVGAA